jgi:Pvc16 N-terminal domain
MSSPLAIAGVTAVLKDHLSKGSKNIDLDLDLAPIGDFIVSAIPPDRIKTGADEENRINLFLYQVTPNLGWRNQGLPSLGSNGERLNNPPLALDLHYMLTTYGKEDLSAEVLWGYAMELFHELVLDRTDIRNLLKLDPTDPAPLKIAQIPPDNDGRTLDDLADQIEQIKISPNYLSADELSRLWTAMQARLRPTMVYQASTVLIQRKKPTKYPLPVIKRGESDRGIQSKPNLLESSPTKPTLKSLAIREPTKMLIRDAAELGDTLVLAGTLLEGNKVTALLSHRLFPNPQELPIVTGAKAGNFEIQLPRGYDLLLMSVIATTDILNEGNYLVIVALVGTVLHIRIFDAIGKKVVDKAENELVGGETLTSLKKRLNPFPDESSLSNQQKQEIIQDAISLAGHTIPKGIDANASRDWPAGPYSVSLQIERAGKPMVQTNVLVFRLAPRISADPIVSVEANKTSVSIQFYPEIRDSQSIEFFVGGDPFKPEPFDGNRQALKIPLTGIKPIEGRIPVGLRVDGVDSILVRDTMAKPPQFDTQQTIVLPI